ncbi:MAG: hypothetical protein ACLFSB_11370 [Chitinispirillaceae bacterium]
MGRQTLSRIRPASLKSWSTMVGLVVFGALLYLWQPDPFMDRGFEPVTFTLCGSGCQLSEPIEGPGKVAVGWEGGPISTAGMVRLVARRERQKQRRHRQQIPQRLEVLDNSIHTRSPRLEEKIRHSARHSFRVSREGNVLVVRIR